MNQLIQVLTTTETKQDADKIASALLERGLAACVQVSGPIESTFRWKNKLERTAEWQCTAKTVAALYGRVEQAIFELHPYELPEVIAVPVTSASAAYVQWVSEQVKSP